MEALKAEGVEHVFGIPGGANLPTYDALYDADLTHIQARHEQGAGHMAEGYAKASGQVGVAMATSGPGATNLVTAIADAIMDSVPTVFITGQVRTELIGTDGFQEADVNGITMPIVKHSMHGPGPAATSPSTSIRPSTSPRPAARARSWWTSPRTSRAPTSSTSRAPRRPTCPATSPRPRATSSRSGSPPRRSPTPSRPVIYAGGGVINANASEELREFCARPTTSRSPAP